MSDLARHYSRFRVSERLLLTGHSHQAWPDVAFEAQQQAWLDAAALVDDKWQRAEEVADDVRGHWQRLLGFPDGSIALGQNTHELVTRFLSAVLPICGRPHVAAPMLVTTDGEFHTIRRQLDRLAEEGVAVVKVPARPVDTLAERLAAEVGEGTRAVLVSSVLFETAEIVPNLTRVADACAARGAELLIDAYHQLNVVPFHPAGLERAFVVGGGYKYCQLGEGNGFLRVPEGCALRPVLTGWFSEFAGLADAARPGEVRYPAGAARFAGATYDPTAHYRAAAAFAFHVQMGLTPDRLRAISQHQTRLLADGVASLDLDPAIAALVPIPADARAGFVALRTPHAGLVVTRLRELGVLADARGELLRLGPAPYLTDRQLVDAVGLVNEALRR